MLELVSVWLQFGLDLVMCPHAIVASFCCRFGQVHLAFVVVIIEFCLCLFVSQCIYICLLLLFDLVCLTLVLLDLLNFLES